MIQASLKTFPLPLTSPDVAGVATVVVYAAGRDQDLVADALTFHVDALTRKGLHVSLHQDTDTHDTLTVTVSANPGSHVSLSGVNWEMYSMQAGNDLTLVKVCTVQYSFSLCTDYPKKINHIISSTYTVL